MKRFTEKKVFSGFTTPWRLAICRAGPNQHDTSQAERKAEDIEDKRQDRNRKKDKNLKQSKAEQSRAEQNRKREEKKEIEK
jgi:hypothetical protein